jgi:hypothetical protein
MSYLAKTQRASTRALTLPPPESIRAQDKKWTSRGIAIGTHQIVPFLDAPGAPVS